MQATIEKLVQLFGFHHSLFENPNLSWEDIKILMKKYGIYTLMDNTIDSISKNPNITPEIVEEYPHIRWNRDVFHIANETHREPITTLDLTELKDIEQKVGIEILSHYATWEVISTYKNDINWCWEWVSANSNITVDIVRNNRDIPWDFRGLSRNPNITIDFVEENKDEEWDLDELFIHIRI